MKINMYDLRYTNNLSSEYHGMHLDIRCKRWIQKFAAAEAETDQ